MWEGIDCLRVTCITFLGFSFDQIVHVNNYSLPLFVGSYWRWCDSIATTLHIGAICCHWCIISILLFRLNERLFRSFHSWKYIRQPDFFWPDHGHLRTEYTNKKQVSPSFDIKLDNEKCNLHEIPKFQLISWCGNLVETFSFCRVLGVSLRKLWLSTKFSHHEIRWNIGILRNVLRRLNPVF